MIAILFDANWRDIHASTLEAPTVVARWIQQPDSLTQGIKAVCRHQFQVHVLRHEFIDSHNIAQTLTSNDDPLLLRQVLLCDGDEALVFATSLLPRSALNGRFQALQNLGNQPLGHWLFAEPVLRRHTFQYRSIAANHTLFNPLAAQNTVSPTTTLTQQTSQLWGRKTLFTGAEKPFLVSEFFLPALENYSPETGLLDKQ